VHILTGRVLAIHQKRAFATRQIVLQVIVAVPTAACVVLLRTPCKLKNAQADAAAVTKYDSTQSIERILVGSQSVGIRNRAATANAGHLPRKLNELNSISP
jgi:hypothetical protein